MTRTVYYPETDDVRITYKRWTEETYPVQGPASIIMVDNGNVVGIILPNFLRSRLESMPVSHKDRTEIAQILIEEDEHWAI